MGRKKIKLLATGRGDIFLMLAVAGLVLLGLLLVFSATSVKSVQLTGNAYKYLAEQAISVLLGLITMVIAYKINIQIIKNYSTELFIIALVFTIAVLFFGIGAYGAKRWLVIGPVNFQPSEVMKIGIILMLAKILDKYKNINLNIYFRCLLLIALAAGFVYAEPDLGTAIVIAVISMSIIVYAGIKFRYFFLTIVAALPLGYIALTAESYRLDRLLSFINPWADASDTGYQVVQSLMSIGSGGLWGTFLGAGKQKLLLPFAHTDFIFAVLAEEMGFIGATITICLFFFVFIRGIIIANRAKSRYEELLCIGLTTNIAIQVIINIAVAIGIAPVTGITLPFLSYGGTSILILMSSVGLILNVSRKQ